MIKIEKLHKSYPIGKDSLHVLKGLDLHIKEGEFVSIMGSSGSGKSTLLNIVGLLDGHDEGKYYLNGQLIENLDEKKAAIPFDEVTCGVGSGTKPGVIVFPEASVTTMLISSLNPVSGIPSRGLKFDTVTVTGM